MPVDALDIVVLYPDLLGLYGDHGNALSLQRRAEARGVTARVIDVGVDDEVPDHGAIYLLGGAEDSSMLIALELLRRQVHTMARIASGAPCLAVCAGLQLLAQDFAGPDDEVYGGLGLLDVHCGRIDGARAVGEVVLDSVLAGVVTGFENHQGNALLGPEAEPLGLVRTGVGNGADGVEGVVQDAVVATYLHGPVLVRNPQLADHLLSRALHRELPPLADPPLERLRRERLRATAPRFWPRRGQDRSSHPARVAFPQPRTAP